MGQTVMRFLGSLRLLLGPDPPLAAAYPRERKRCGPLSSAARATGPQTPNTGCTKEGSLFARGQSPVGLQCSLATNLAKEKGWALDQRTQLSPLPVFCGAQQASGLAWKSAPVDFEKAAGS